MVNPPTQSNSIHNTNVEIIKMEIDSMIELLETGVTNSETLLQRKYNCLYKTSPTLFKYLLKNGNKKGEEKVQMVRNVNVMLGLILKIQTSEISQYDASSVVGKYIGEQYIPQLIEKN